MKKNRQNVFQLGFIGGGLSSSIGQTHLLASQLDGRWKLVSGFFSRKHVINTETANVWKIDQNRVYDSLQEFILSEKSKLDAVVVLTPAPDHVLTISKLLENGFSIICDKPLASTLEEGYEIQKKHRQYPNFFAVTYNYSGYPMVRELQDLIKNGSLGKIQKIHFEMPQEGFARISNTTGQLHPPKDWRLKDGLIPTICLDLGVHLHHLANFLINKDPIKVMGFFSNHSTYKNVLDDAMMWIEYEDEVTGSFWMSKTALGNRNGLRLRLFGTKGSAEWLQTDPENLYITYQDGTRTILDRASKVSISNKKRYNRYIAGHPAGFIEAFANLYSDVADALDSFYATGTHENNYVFDVDHSVKGLELLSAARESNDLKKWINLYD
jgi:predicted dehydrogenase